jgi:hypothetical protein
MTFGVWLGTRLVVMVNLTLNVFEVGVPYFRANSHVLGTEAKVRRHMCSFQHAFSTFYGHRRIKKETTS